MLQERYRQEIERAINNVKRSVWDKSFRRQWYRAGSQVIGDTAGGVALRFPPARVVSLDSRLDATSANEASQPLDYSTTQDG